MPSTKAGRLHRVPGQAGFPLAMAARGSAASPALRSPAPSAGLFGLLHFAGPCHEVVVRRRDGLGAARAQGGLREGLPGGDAGGCPARHYQRRLQSHRQPQHRERFLAFLTAALAALPPAGGPGQVNFSVGLVSLEVWQLLAEMRPAPTLLTETFPIRDPLEGAFSRAK